MKKWYLSYIQIIAVGFMLIILTGAVLLSLPAASRTGNYTPFIDSLFTAASATCVTGLVVYDTYTHWSFFGQIVILLLIQTGGLGFMSMATLISMFLRRKIGLKERELMKEAVSSMYLGGIVRLTRHVLIGTLLCESIGAILLALRFCPEMGLWQGIYYGIFHSVSAFCNAGFDLMGRFGQFSSLTRYSGDILVNLVIMSLIVIGGIGFFVWEDIHKHKLSFHSYQLHTKIVLTTTAALIIVPSILFFLMERGYALKEMDTLQAVIASVFQSVTPRTAGFNTVDIASLRSGTLLLTIILMMIGGSSGSTAGGIKTTTLAVLIMSAISVIKGRDFLRAYERKLEGNALRRACAVFLTYLAVAMSATLILSMLQDFTMEQLLFEVFSAMSTVGLTTGITPVLSAASKLQIALLMYFGRVGVLSIALAFTKTPENIPVEYPCEKIMIG